MLALTERIYSIQFALLKHVQYNSEPLNASHLELIMKFAEITSSNVNSLTRNQSMHLNVNVFFLSVQWTWPRWIFTLYTQRCCTFFTLNAIRLIITVTIWPSCKLFGNWGLAPNSAYIVHIYEPFGFPYWVTPWRCPMWCLLMMSLLERAKTKKRDGCFSFFK